MVYGLCGFMAAHHKSEPKISILECKIPWPSGLRIRLMSARKHETRRGFDPRQDTFSRILQFIRKF
jgi:hypothetical protein